MRYDMTTLSDLVYDIELEIACLLDDLEVNTLEEDVMRLQKMMVTLSNDLYHRGIIE